MAIACSSVRTLFCDKMLANFSFEFEFESKLVRLEVELIDDDEFDEYRRWQRSFRAFVTIFPTIALPVVREPLFCNGPRRFWELRCA